MRIAVESKRKRVVHDKDRKRLQFNDGTWGYWVTDIEILEEGIDITNPTEALTRWAIDRGLVNPKIEEVVEVLRADIRSAFLIRGRNR